MKYLFILFAIVLASCKLPNKKDSAVNSMELIMLVAG